MKNKEIEEIAKCYLEEYYKNKVVRINKKGKGYELRINRNKYEIKSTTAEIDNIYSRYLTESEYKSIIRSKWVYLIIVFNVNKGRNFNKMYHIRLGNKKLRKLINKKPEKWYKIRMQNNNSRILSLNKK